MTDQSMTTLSKLGAEEIHARAVDWMLERRDAEHWTTEDQANLDAWLEESPSHLVAYWRAESSWERTEILSALRTVRRQPPAPPRSGRRRMLSGIAASAVVIGLLSGGAVNFLAPKYETYSTAIGEHKTLKLADGSQIELNTDTVVRLAHADKRNVILERGEAFFQVEHNTYHPFVVTAGQRRVTDLGTKFLIRRHSDALQVMLYEGQARFDDETRRGTIQSLVLLPGDAITAAADSFSKSRKSASDLSAELGWRRGVLIFRHTRLVDVAKEFNRYNSRRLSIVGASVANRQIRGTFHTADVASFAQVAQEALGLKVATRGNEIVISQ